MKLLKSFALLSLSSVLALNTALATEQTAEKPRQKQVTNSTKEDKNLKEFNRNAGVVLTHRGYSNEPKPTVTLTYEIENKSSRNVKAMTWIGVFTIENKVIFAQEIPLKFNPPLKAKSKESITVNIPLENISEESRQYFLSQEANVGSLNVAKLLTFTNGKKIVIK